MRHQHRLDVEERPLNEKEEQILAEFNKKHKKNLYVRSVRYERHTPRVTVCIALFESIWWMFSINSKTAFGVSIKTKTDKEVPETGQEFAFKRALHDYVERKNDR